MTESKVKPQSEIRILYNADTGTCVGQFPFEPSKREDLYPFVDELAANGADVYIPDVFNAAMTLYNSKVAPRWDEIRERYYTTNMVAKIFSLGVEPLAVWAERCHEKGMRIIPSFRMNDRHNLGRLDDPMRAAMMGPFLKQHTELWIKDYPGALDYQHQEVRDFMFSVLEEVARDFDVDGLDLNYMRHVHVFDRAHAREHAPILTDFMGRVRGMLDEEGREKGRRLLLGVEVPLSLDECHMLGFEIERWVGEGLIDYIAPMAFNSTCFDAPFDEFARVTRGSECSLYPVANPYPAPRYKRILMSLPAYRGFARNAFVQGGDGIYLFNFMYHWSGAEGMAYPGPPEMYPKAFSYFDELRDPQRLNNVDRHYASLPNPGPVGLTDRVEKIVLSRQALPSSDSYTFRAAEDFGGGRDALVEFAAEGLLPGDEIRVKFNGKVVPQEQVKRVFHEEGRTDDREGDELDPYTTCTFVPETPPAQPTEQVLEVTLLAGAEDGSGEIRIREIELAVSCSERDPAEIMSLIHEQSLPPLPVLAGYRARYSSVWNERESSVDIGEEVLDDGTVEHGELAQRFVLRKDAEIDRAEVFIYPGQHAKRDVLLSVQSDADGRPSGERAPGAAIVRFSPEKNREILNRQLQGYYQFELPEPLRLSAGTYWLVFGVDSERDRIEGGEEAHVYRVHMRSGGYPEGVVLRRQGQGRWQRVGQTTFFGVHGSATKD